MADLSFNTTSGAVVERRLLVLYLNTGTSETPVWSPLGKRVEDSSLEYDWGSESKTDIFGNSYTTLKKPQISQSFDPCELDASDAAQVKLWNAAVKDQNLSTLANQDVLLVHLYAGTAGTAMFAERYPSSAITPSKIGGSVSLGMPIDVTFGGTRTTGTAAIAAGVVTYTPAA